MDALLWDGGAALSSEEEPPDTTPVSRGRCTWRKCTDGGCPDSWRHVPSPPRCLCPPAPGGKKQAGEHQLPHRLVPEEAGIVHVVGKTAVDQQAQVRGAVPVQVPQVGSARDLVRIREAVQAFIEVEPVLQDGAGGDGLEQDRAVPHLHLTDEHRALHAVDGRLVKLQGESAAIREGEGAAGRFPVQPQLLWRAYCALYGLRYFPGPVSEAQAGSEAQLRVRVCLGCQQIVSFLGGGRGGQQVAAIGGGEGTDLPGGGEALRLPGIAALLSEPLQPDPGLLIHPVGQVQLRGRPEGVGVVIGPLGGRAPVGAGGRFPGEQLHTGGGQQGQIGLLEFLILLSGPGAPGCPPPPATPR